MNGQLVDGVKLVGSLYTNINITGNIRADNMVGNLTLGNQTKTTYSGSYVITPTATGQTLNTNNKIMGGNVYVEEIPYVVVPNDYGETIYIG